MTIVKITKDMFEKMEYDTATGTTNVMNAADMPSTVQDPTVMLVLSGSDLNAASYHLVKSLQNPLTNTIVTVLVQESILIDFTAKVQDKIVAYKPAAALADSYAAIMQKIKQFNAKTIQPKEANEGNTVGPTIVYDFTHEQLGINVGVIATLHAFRTTKEANALCQKQGINFVNASIWCENHARAYEIIAAQAFKNFFIDCFDVNIDCLREFIEKKHSAAFMDKGYHYETMIAGEGSQKTVVFPYGTIFAN